MSLLTVVVNIIKFVGYFIMYAFIMLGILIIIGLSLYLMTSLSFFIIPLVIIGFIAFLAFQRMKK